MPPDALARVLAAFGRAGFSGAVARRVMRYEREEAEDLLHARTEAAP
jgi:hypothetical protein